MTESLSLDLKDELSIIMIWIGIWGISDMILKIPFMNSYRHYFYLLLILIGLYNKV